MRRFDRNSPREACWHHRVIERQREERRLVKSEGGSQAILKPLLWGCKGVSRARWAIFTRCEEAQRNISDAKNSEKSRGRQERRRGLLWNHLKAEREQRTDLKDATPQEGPIIVRCAAGHWAPNRNTNSATPCRYCDALPWVQAVIRILI